MKLVMNHLKEKPKRGRPKKAIIKFSSLNIKEYCCLPGGSDLYMKIKKTSKGKNCIIMQTGQAANLPLEQIVCRVEKETIRPAMPQLELIEQQQVQSQSVRLQPAQSDAQTTTIVKFPHTEIMVPDVVIDLDDDD